MGTWDPQGDDPDEELMMEKSRRLIAEMEALIRRAKILQLEHKVIVARIREKREGNSDEPSDSG